MFNSIVRRGAGGGGSDFGSARPTGGSVGAVEARPRMTGSGHAGGMDILVRRNKQSVFTYVEG